MAAHSICCNVAVIIGGRGRYRRCHVCWYVFGENEDVKISGKLIGKAGDVQYHSTASVKGHRH
jgi:hypothetical protein